MYLSAIITPKQYILRISLIHILLHSTYSFNLLLNYQIGHKIKTNHNKLK